MNANTLPPPTPLGTLKINLIFFAFIRSLCCRGRSKCVDKIKKTYYNVIYRGETSNSTVPRGVLGNCWEHFAYHSVAYHDILERTCLPDQLDYQRRDYDPHQPVHSCHWSRHGQGCYSYTESSKLGSGGALHVQPIPDLFHLPKLCLVFILISPTW